MKNLTKDEKGIILDALQHFHNGIENLPDDTKEELTFYQQRIDIVWTKITLDIHEIRVKDNNMSVRTACVLCGATFTPEPPVWAFLVGDSYHKALCDECIEKHAPERVKDKIRHEYKAWCKEMGFDKVEAEPVICTGDLPF